MDLIVRNSRIRGSESKKDIGIDGGKIVKIAGKIEGRGEREIDAKGRLVAPPLVNAHVHLDKCLTGDWVRSTLGASSCADVIGMAAEIKRKFTVEDIEKRAGKGVELAVLHGGPVIRAFADVDTIGGLTAVKALTKVRDRYRNIADIQVVAFPQEGIVRDEGSEELMWKAMELGADVVGGIPWYEYLDDDVRRHVDIAFQIAKHFDRDIGMLVDDTDDPNSRSLEYLAVKTIREKYFGRVAASHCGALTAYDDYHAKRVIDLVKKAGITIVSNPHISLMINGRLDKQPMRRGITRVRELLEAGENVASGQDDVDDPYYPFGRADMLEVGYMMCHAAQMSLPNEIEKVFDMITVNGAKALRIKDYGIEVGKRANLIVFDAYSVPEAFRMQSSRLFVIKDGHIVAENTVNRKLHI